MIGIAWLVWAQSAFCFYDASTGRWLSRDPIGERGGFNLPATVHNDMVGMIDPAGLIQWMPNLFVKKVLVKSLEKPGQDVTVEYLRGKTDKGTDVLFWRPLETTDYWCHGYTFDGSTAKDGPFSPSGYDVPKILQDEWKKVPCACAEGGIIVIYKGEYVQHSGKVTHIDARENPLGSGSWQLTEYNSMLRSKWDSNGVLAERAFQEDWRVYGGYYSCYIKAAECPREPKVQRKGRPPCDQVKKGNHEQ